MRLFEKELHLCRKDLYIHINVELEQFEQLFSLPGQFGVSAHRFLDFSLDFQNRTVQFCN